MLVEMIGHSAIYRKELETLADRLTLEVRRMQDGIISSQNLWSFLSLFVALRAVAFHTFWKFFAYLCVFLIMFILYKVLIGHGEYLLRAEARDYATSSLKTHPSQKYFVLHDILSPHIWDSPDRALVYWKDKVSFETGIGKK